MTWLMKVITTHDGFLDAKSNRRLGKRDLDINESHNKSNHVEFQKMGINRDMSTRGMLHSIGPDLTHTWGKSETHQNGSIRSKQNGLRARDYGNTPTSRAERTHFGLGFLETTQIQMHQNLFHRVSLQLSNSSKNVGENGCLDRKKHLSSATDLFSENSEDKMVSTAERVKSFQTDEDPSLVKLLFQYGNMDQGY
ncbi:unnamed protein product [Camellia sinensis]